MSKAGFLHSTAGLEAFQAGNYDLALHHWRKAREISGSSSFDVNIKIAERLYAENMGQERTGKIKVAAIMDTFTSAAFAHECDLLQLRPDAWQAQLEEFKPLFVLVESAWRGVDELWNKKISIPSEEIAALFAWCRKQGLPTVLWNKEDPPNFQHFFHIAELADYIFTVDMDMIPRYKSLLGHERVYLLPFFAQPALFNPLEKYDRKNRICFAGSWIQKYPRRLVEFTELVNALRENPGVDIYDRNLGNPELAFPEEFQNLIRGTLPFDQIDLAYKGYKYGLNMNSVKNSSTMFARRCYELMASNTVVLSNYARGLRNIFGDLVLCADSGTQMREKMERYLDCDHNYRRFRLLGLRKVMLEYTCGHALETILQKLGATAPSPPRLVTMFAKVENADQKKYALDVWRAQTWPNTRLVLLQTFKDGALSDAITCFSLDSFWKELGKDRDTNFWALLDLRDYYGPNYIMDLVLATRYSDARMIGKNTHFSLENGGLALKNPGSQYRMASNPPAASSILSNRLIGREWLKHALGNPQIPMPGEYLAVDEFSYIKAGRRSSAAQKAHVNDLPLEFQGLPRARLLDLAGTAPSPRKGRDFSLTPAEMLDYFGFPVQIEPQLTEKGLKIVSRLPQNTHKYCYAKKFILKSAFPLKEGDTLRMEGSGTNDVYMYISLEDENKQKVDGAILTPVRPWLASYPPGVYYIMLSLRVKNPGEYFIKSISSLPQIPYAPLPAAHELHIFPGAAPGNRERKLENCEIFELSEISVLDCGMEGDTHVLSGPEEYLRAILQAGSYARAHVHGLNSRLWRIVKDCLDTQAFVIHVPDFSILRRTGPNPQEHLAAKITARTFLELWPEILSLHCRLILEHESPEAEKHALRLGWEELRKRGESHCPSEFKIDKMLYDKNIYSKKVKIVLRKCKRTKKNIRS